MYSRRKNTVSIVCLPPLLFHLICPLHPIPLSVLPSPSQASNGGLSSNYPSSLPSTPVISHRELRGGAGTGVGAGGEGGGSVTSSGSLRNVPQRRTSLFKVSYCSPNLCWSKLEDAFISGTMSQRAIQFKPTHFKRELKNTFYNCRL